MSKKTLEKIIELLSSLPSSDISLGKKFLANRDFESKLISTYNADFDGDCIDIPSLLKLFAEECERKIIS